MSDIKLYFDGACWPPNGGTCKASYGFIIQQGESVVKGDGLIGIGPQYSNNYAEFEALYRGLWKLYQSTSFDAMDNLIVSVYGDSKLVINVMNKKWRATSDKRYYSAFKAADAITRSLRKNGVTVSFHWIPRELNQDTDDLSKITQ